MSQTRDADRRARRAAYMREWRRRPASVAHGTLDAYKNHMCRCSKCAEAYREYWSEYRAKSGVKDKRDANRDKHRLKEDDAPRSRTEWTGVELQLATERAPDGTYLRSNKEVAAITGRSVTAVNRMRQRCLTEPRYARLAGLEGPVADAAKP